MTKDLIPTIPDSEIAPKAPVSSSLMTKLRDGDKILSGALDSSTTNMLEGAADSIVTTTLVDANPTSGFIARNDQFDGYYLHFTSGAIFSGNSRNRFKILTTNLALDSFTFTEDLAAAGGLAGDTYVILGHTHDANASDPDGEGIDFKNLINVAEDLGMTQALVDAIMDPDSLRTLSATKTNPLVTLADANLVTEYTEAGKSQSRTGTTAPFGNSHTLVLPLPSIKYLILLTFDITSNGTINAEILQDISSVSITILKQVSNAERGGTLIVIAEDGDKITAHNGLGQVGTPGGTAFATFDIISFVELS